MAKRKKNKMKNNDLQYTTQKTKDRVTRTPLKTGDEIRYSGRVGCSCHEYLCDEHSTNVSRWKARPGKQPGHIE